MTLDLPKMAIISTYKVECGIAYYTGYIEEELSKSFDVKVMPLDQRFFSSTYPPYVKRAASITNKIAEDVRSFDVVVIQLEYGIFGRTYWQIWNRLKPILDSSKKIIVVFHTFLSPRLSFMNLVHSPSLLGPHINKLLYSRIQDKIFRYLDRKKKNNYSIIIQTKREELYIQSTYNVTYLYCHPLAYLSMQRINALNQQPTRRWLVSKYGLNETDVIVGFFGFITAYKGVETAIKAVLKLPERYKLVIFGGTHPGSIVDNQKIEPYLGELVQLIEASEEQLNKSIKKISISDNLLEIKGNRYTTKTKPRIIFAGHQTNDEFESAFHGCDFVVLPYLEVGQTSSGPAAIAVQLEKKAILSRTLCYKEFERFARGCYHSFDIGNHIVLSQCIQRFNESDTKEAMKTFNARYNLETRAKCYLDAYRAMA